MCEPRRPVVGVCSRSRLEQRAATSPSARALRVASYVHARARARASYRPVAVGRLGMGERRIGSR